MKHATQLIATLQAPFSEAIMMAVGRPQFAKGHQF